MPIFGFLVFAAALYLLFRFFRASFAWVREPELLAAGETLPMTHALQIGLAIFLGFLALVIGFPEVITVLACGIPFSIIGGVIAYFVLNRRRNAAITLLNHSKPSDSSQS